MNERGGELTEDRVAAIEGSRNGMLWRDLVLGTGITLGEKQQGGDGGAIAILGRFRVEKTQAMRGGKGIGSGFSSEM